MMESLKEKPRKNSKPQKPQMNHIIKYPFQDMTDICNEKMQNIHERDQQSHKNGKVFVVHRG